MTETDDKKIKTEIDDIMDRVETIMKKVDTLDPFKKSPPTDQPAAPSTEPKTGTPPVRSDES